MKPILQPLLQISMLIFAIFCYNFSLAQIPNWNMESWTTVTNEAPLPWGTFGAISKISPGENGLYAIKLKGDSAGNRSDPGAVLYGTPSKQNFFGGTPFTARPDSMIAYFKYSIVAGDSAWVILSMKKNGVAISNDLYKYSGAHTSGYERKAFKINYKNGVIPDTMFIGFTSTNVDAPSIDTTSYVILDNISFTGTTQNIPNPDFENWTTQTNFTPDGWDYRIKPGGISVERTTDKYSGNYAMKLQTIFGSYSDTIRGSTETTGRANLSQWGPAFPINSRPDSLKGFYKFFPQNLDTFNVNLGLFKNGMEVGNGFFSSASAVSLYSPFSAPINYHNFPTGNPDSAYITIATFFTNQSNNRPRGQSVAYIDNLSFANTVVLPVNFIGFTATKKNNTVILNWQIENESSLTDRYEVERSFNGIDFKKIITIAPKNNDRTANSYIATDVDLSTIRSSGVIYYRVKQIDKDGRFIYTEIQTIALDGKVFSATIYPDPVNEKATLSIELANNAAITIIINDATGKQVQMIRMKGLKGLNTKEINMGNLATGSYMLQIKSGAGIKTLSVIKD